MKAFRSDLIVVTLKTAFTKRKIIQIFFGKDNSVYVNFPYFHHREGILASATMPANKLHPQDINLTVGGKVASHLVKYSHHPDGRAHFSQHGRVRTEIKRQSVALDRQDGHMFTVMFQGLTAFDEAEPENPAPTSKRTTITFEFTETPEPAAFKIIGRWQDISSIQYNKKMIEPNAGPILAVQKPDGNQQLAFVLANPLEGTRHILLLTCEAIPALSKESTTLTFIGGFDAHEVVANPTLETGFLAFIYPASDVEQLRQTIGSIDYHSSS